MRRRSLGRSGLSVSRLALGTMAWGTRTKVEDAGDLWRAFLTAGGSFIDTAHGYAGGASEETIGRLLAETPRDDVTLCSKAGISRTSTARVVDVSRGALLSQLDLSLRRLGTDHLDLWLVHTWSSEVPLEETLGALESAVQTGKVRYVGVSNYSGWQVARASSLLQQVRVPLVANQIEYSLLDRGAEHEVVEAAQALGFGLMPWSPLGRGVLTGKYRKGIPADSRAASADLRGFTARHLGEHTEGVVEAVATAARGLGVSPSEVALAWVRDRPGVVSPVIGPRTLPHLKAALATEDLELPEQIVDALDEVSLGSL